MTNDYLYKVFFTSGDTYSGEVYRVSLLMILCSIALPDLAIHVTKQEYTVVYNNHQDYFMKHCNI